jgi:hypothetical protein
MRYDIDGKLQKTPLDAGAGAAPAAKEDSSDGGRGGRRGGRVKEKVIENKKEEFGEMMKGLAQLVGSYGQLPQDKLAAFAKGATTTPGEGAAAGTIKIAGTNVLMDKDSLAIWIDPKTKMMRRIELGSFYDEKPVTAISEYRSLDNGVTYQARATLQYPEKAVEVIIENYDYQHTSGAK